MRRVLVVAGLVLAVGCGSGDGGSGVATLSGGDGTKPTASASADPEDAFRRYAKCMRENGVDMPDPGKPGDGAVVIAPSAAPQRMQEAEQKCGHHLKDAVREGPKMNDPAMQDRALKFARCMREHGIEMPDPGTDGAIRKRIGDGSDVKPPFDPRDPKFQAAQKECGGLLGNAPGMQPGTITLEGS